MLVGRLRATLMLCGAAAIAACGGGGTEPGNNRPSTPSILSAVSGNGQTGLVGSTASLPLTVKVLSSNGTPVKGATVSFTIASGAATVAPASATTDTSGVAKTLLTFGSTPGIVQVSATVIGTSLSTTFTAASGTGTIASACTAGAAQTPALGSVQAGVASTGVCLGGGTSGADYALVAFNTNQDSALVAASFAVKSSGATPLASVSVAPLGVAQEAPLMSPLRATRVDVSAAFDRRLRDAANRDLVPLIPSARQFRHQNASFASIPTPLTVGQTITLNAQGDPNFACSNPINVRAKVVAISNNAIIVADSTNPTNGFTSAEYASFATTFDTLVNPLDVGAFGQPTDIDGNGKIVILFTKEVNKLTPRGSGGFIGGFFFERDLFPTTTDTKRGLDGCATSNYGEMFYLLVPDPSGTFSDPRSKTDVLDNTVGTLAHEYQHLINAGRRIYVNDAAFFETVWLNEGLSHVAEELAYYRVSAQAPRQNIAIAQINSNPPASIVAFNNFQADNLGRYEVFIGKPSRTNVYGDNDSLETRGATWNMLRYLADHHGSNDGTVWNQLVNTTLSGHQNLAAVFGNDYMTQIRDWATSVFTDDVTGVTDARYLEPSWNMRNIFPQLCADNRTPCTRLGRFPLQVTPLGDTSPANLSIVAGGAAYVRFTVPANGKASIDWSASNLPVNPLVQFTLVRTR